MKRCAFINSVCVALIYVLAMMNFTSFGVPLDLMTEPSVPVSNPTYIIQLQISDVVGSQVEVEEESAVQPAVVQKQWTDEEAVVLAKMLWGEARGIQSDAEKAAVIWCVLNRVDAYGKSIIDVTTAPNQFVGYRSSNPVDEKLYDLCEDVLGRYFAEKNGEQDVGRVLPADYLFFSGDGQHNRFRNAYRGGDVYNWSLRNPYET